jgi:hypothetical protein
MISSPVRFVAQADQRFQVPSLRSLGPVHALVMQFEQVLRAARRLMRSFQDRRLTISGVASRSAR